MSDPAGKGVIHRGLQKNIQFVCCSEPGCSATLEVPIKGSPKPGDVILNMARRRGWHIVNDGRKTRQCPAHNERVKKLTAEQVAELSASFKVWFECNEPLKTDRKNALIAELLKLGLDRVTKAKNEAHRTALLDLLEAPQLNPPEPAMTKTPNEGLTLLPLSESLKLPTDAARAQRRKVFYEIEEYYGEGGYKVGFSDAYIATKLAVSVGMVAEVREMNFGPAGPDPRIADLRQKVRDIEARVGQIEDKALAVMDHAEKMAIELRREIASLTDKINKLEGTL
jgi:phage host-nuclease inhibitor protein Gam